MFLFLLRKELKVTENGAFLHIEFLWFCCFLVSISQGTYFALNIVVGLWKVERPLHKYIQREGLKFCLRPLMMGSFFITSISCWHFNLAYSFSIFCHYCSNCSVQIWERLRFVLPPYLEKWLVPFRTVRACLYCGVTTFKIFQEKNSIILISCLDYSP